MNKIKILHIASFNGNIGDSANHNGFYSLLEKIIKYKVEQLEIRKFYKNRSELKFDDTFVDYVNKFDLLVLGGGGFFDLKWDYSRTGTTIDFSDEIVDGIKIPVLVNSMGYHEYQTVSAANIKKFKKFLETILLNQKWLVTVRNDGSYDRLSARYGSLVKTIVKVPDNGFFYQPSGIAKHYDEYDEYKYIGINITNELFSKKFNKEITEDIFNNLIGSYLNELLKIDRVKIIFFPHTIQDIATISSVFQFVEDKYKRESVAVAPYFNGGKMIDQEFCLYKKCLCIIGMRFHANVCGIAMNIPTIGLAGHEQISSLYDEIGLSDRCVKIDDPSFISKLDLLLTESIKNSKKIIENYFMVNKNVMTESQHYLENIHYFLKQNYEK